MKKSLKNIRIWTLIALLLIFTTSVILIIKTTDAESGKTELVSPKTTVRALEDEIAVPEAEYIFSVTKNNSDFVAEHTGGSADGSLGTFSGINFRTVINNAILEVKNNSPIPIIEFAFPSDTALNIGTSNMALTGGSFIVSGKITGSSNIMNFADGTLYIASGEISCTELGTPIQNNGILEMSGGTVSSYQGTAIYNSAGGTVNISGTAFVSASVGSSTSGTIFNSSNGTINISGGTVVGKNNGSAVYNKNGGEVNVSGTALVTGSGLGETIYNETTGTITVSGGTVENTSSQNAIFNCGVLMSFGKVIITGGKVSANSCAVRNHGSGEINISGTAEITSTVFSSSNGTIYNQSNGLIAISGGTVEGASQGSAIYSYADGTIKISGGTVKNTSTGCTIYNYCKDNSVGKIEILNGTVSANTNAAIMNFGPGVVSVNGEGALVTSAVTYELSGTINNRENGKIMIYNGTVEHTSGGKAIYNTETGKIELSHSPVIDGDINTQSGRLESLNGFSPQANKYSVLIRNGKIGDIAVLNGAAHIDCFIPADAADYKFKAQGENIIIAANKLDGDVSVTLSGWIYGSPNEPNPVISEGNYINITYYYIGRGDTTHNSDIKPLDAGNYTVTATFHETDNYSTATASAHFTINAREVEITLDNSEKVYGDSDSAFSYAITGGSVIEGDNLGITEITREQGEDAGIYTVYITWSNTNYIVTASADFTITPKEIVIIINDANKALGADDPDFNYTVPDNGLIGNETLGNVTYERIEGEELGTYSIYSITWDNLNYSAEIIIPGTLTIHKNLQDPLYITSPNTHMFGINYEITAEGGSLEGVRFEIAGGSGTGFIDGNILIIYTGGTFILRAVMDGDEYYEPVISEDFQLTVTLQKFMIDFLNSDGSLIKRIEAEYGTAMSSLLPSDPVMSGYKFVRWEGYLAGMTVTGNAIFTAVYTLAPGQKYTVNFYDENGMTLIKSVQAVKGADVSLLFPTPPSKTGLVFARWDIYNPQMTVSGNHSFKAVYTPASEQKYTVTFLNENGSIIKIIPDVVKGTNVATLFPFNPVKVSTAEFTYTFNGWQGYTLGDTVNEDITLTASFTATLNAYTIIFKDYNGNLIATYLLDYGETIIPPAPPTRDGYEFIHWENFINGMTITSNATFTAVYTSFMQKYTVTFYDEDGETIIDSVEAYGGTSVVSLMPIPPEKEGFIFVRWEGHIAHMLVYENLNFTAVYVNDTEETFTVTFLDDDGTVIKIVYGAVKGTDISMFLPLNPSKERSAEYIYRFVGWQGYTPGDTVQGDLTFTAEYSGTLIAYLIIFKDYDTSIIAFYRLVCGETIIPPANPEREGFEFIRWEGFTDGLTVSGLTVFTAVYTPILSEKYTVTFYDEDGTIISQTEEYEGVSIASLLPAPPEKEGFVFVRWDGYTAGLTVTGNVSFTAVYANNTEETFTITFLDYNGTVIKVVYDVVKGSDISTLLPTDPFKEATTEFTYYFRGWYGFTIGDIIDGNLILTASYTAVLNTYTISFYDEDGKLLARYGAEYGALLSEFLIEPPKKESFVFARWQGYTAGMILTSDIEFTAVYVEEGAQLYIITFYDEDGTIIAKLQALNGADLSTLLPEPPVKESYLFARWEGYLAGMAVDGNMEFIAVYTAESEQRYTVIFLDDNETVIKILFDIVKGTDISTLFPAPPNKAAIPGLTYAFTGWFEYNASDIVEGNLFFIAVYAEIVNTCTVTFIDWDGTIIQEAKLSYGETITLPVEPYREGYEFIRWENFINGMKITQNISFTAVYAFEPETFTVTFYDGEEEILKIENVPNGSSIDLPLPVPPDKFGFKFIRWEGYTIGMLVTDNVDFYAVYDHMLIESFSVMFFYDDGLLFMLYPGITKGTDISTILPADNPVKPPTAKYTYVFNGWSGFNYGDTVQNQLILLASFTEVLNTYTVKFLDWDGSEIEIINGAAYGTHISELLPDNPKKPSIAGLNYTFSGWKGYFKGMTVADNISFTAAYKEEPNKYTVTFLNWDGSTLYQITVFYGESATYDTIPIRTGYTFLGWDEELEFIAGDLTVTALYSINEYVITINDGESESEITFEYGAEITLPKDPVRKGYLFEGWYLDEECTVKCDFTAMPAENITIYAKWTKEPGFPVYVIVILALVFIIIMLAVVISVKNKNKKIRKDC